MVRNSKGFTLIELLIVVVIIGILATIAIPQFASTKEKAFDASAKSDIRNAMSAMEAYYTDNQVYATNALGSGNFTTSQGITISSAGSAAGYAITSTHASSSNSYHVTVGSAGGTTQGRILKN